MLDALADGVADVTVDGVRLAGADLAGAVGAFARSVHGRRRIAVVADASLQTVVAVAGALAAGVEVVPLNPSSGTVERAQLLADAAVDLVVTPDHVDLSARAALPSVEVEPSAVALIVYTSGTTGAPKGAVLSRRAVIACLDGLASVWSWSASDTLVHALPMFHVHGLVLGTLGPLRIGSRLVRTDRFTSVDEATMYFAVPTMWSRIDDASLTAMRTARLLVSGSASLPARVAARVEAGAGQQLVERYGLTESLIVTAARMSGPREAGDVGHPLPGVELRVADGDETGLGEVQLRGPTLFDGYLNQADATAAAFTGDGWFRTGDLGRYSPATGLRLFGRMATDLIKTGGYKVGAGEVEDALLAHPAVSEAAVAARPDDDLGERIVAWVVASSPVEADALVAYVAETLSPHKRPREIRFVGALPRNAMGKLQKTRLP